MVRVHLPLLWRVLLANAAILAVAFAVLAPVSLPLAGSEVALLSLALLALNLFLLRSVFAPLEGLAEAMRSHDPLSPGARAEVDGDPSVAALAEAFNEMLDRMESERRESALAALMAQEGERRRVARELQDEVGQTLTGVMLQIEGLALTAPDELRPQLDELRETARHGTEEVRRIARRLQPGTLEALGLGSGLAALATAVEARGAVRVRRHLEPAPALNREQELVIYRVAQEALTNVVRHAGASTVELVLAHDPERTVLTVDDDGHGLAPDGVRGMRERALLIGADLHIGPRPGHGTRVQLIVPHA